MSDRQLSLQEGKYANFLAEVKHKNPKLYDAYKRYGIQEYSRLSKNIRTDLGNMYYELSLKRKLKSFYRTNMKDLFTSYEGMYQWFNRTAFSSIENLNVNSFKKAKKVLKIYNDTKDNK